MLMYAACYDLLRRTATYCGENNETRGTATQRTTFSVNEPLESVTNGTNLASDVFHIHDTFHSK